MSLLGPGQDLLKEQRYIGRAIRTDGFRAAAILVGVLHVAFFLCIWGNRSLLASAKDASSVMPYGAWAGSPSGPIFSRTLDNGGGGFQGEPSLPLLRYQYLHEHTAPLWDPYQGYGTPLAADQQSQPFYPLTVALLLHISPRTYNWFVLARLFVAGIAAYFYLRFFVSFWPAIAGGITSMLAGYYVLFITMPQLSAEVMLPASLLAAEYTLRKRTYWAMVAFAAAVLLVFLGGMPESALLLFTLLYGYILFRIASDFDLRRFWLQSAAAVAAGTIAGAALAAFFMLPFWEFMRRCFDLHKPENVGGFVTGLYSDPFGLSIFTYMFPLLFGPPATPISPIRNYVGLISVFFALIGLAALFGKKRGSDPSLRAISWFFLGAVVLIELKRYGVPVVNSLGTFSFFKLVNFPKYEEALLSICMSILGAIGMERLLRRDVPVRAQIILLLLAICLIPAAFWWSRDILSREIAQRQLRLKFPVMALVIPSILMIGTAALLVLSWMRKVVAGTDARFAIWLVALVSAEMCFNFIAPTHFWSNKLAPLEHNPFAGAPYIDVMKEQRPGTDRIFARDGLLFPNWAAAFQLYDIRYLNAMYDKKYFRFLQNFFQDQKRAISEYDLSERFNGTGIYELTTPLAMRLLQLSSVRQIGSIRPFVTSNRLVAEALEQSRGHLIRGKERNISKAEFILSGKARLALGEYSPYERLPYRIHIGTEPRQIFAFSYAIDPAVFEARGDGVEFIVETKDAAGKIVKQFSQYIDPKHDKNARRWMDGQVDLSMYRGQTIDLLFTTAPGPKGDKFYDWAAWSNFHFLGQDLAALEEKPPFQLIYNAEAKIYRYDNVLPRAAIYHHAELAADENDALKKLADPSLDVFQSVVLNQSGLKPEQRTRVAEINRQAPVRVEAASIRSYKSQDVQIDASLDRAGILVLNDTGYPGWVVQVDGRPAEWIAANYMFRGVLLPPGRHAVRFLYQPESFRIGSAVSGLTMACLLVVGFARRKKTRPAAAVAS